MMQFSRTQRKQFTGSYGVFIINGMLALSIGSLIPFIREAKGFDYVFSGLLVSLHSVGNLLASFLAGILPAFLGRKRSILLFNACFAAAYGLILLGESPVVLALAFIMTGMARGATSNFCNSVLNEIGPGKAWMLNGLHGMFSIGAFLFPILLMLITGVGGGSWETACGFMLVMGLLSWGIYAMMPVEETAGRGDSTGCGETAGRGDSAGCGETAGRGDSARCGETADRGEAEAAGAEDSHIFGFFKEPLFYLCTVTLFFYLCAEQGVIGWLITYFKDTGLMSPELSQVMASVQWIMMLAGRLGVAWLSVRADKNKLLRIMGVGFTVFGLLLLAGRTAPLIVAGIMGFGLSMAGIYPTTVSFAGALMQKYRYVWSFILTLASLGSILMPSIIGRIAEKAGIAAGMSSVLAVVVMDMLLIFVLTGYRRRHGGE